MENALIRDFKEYEKVLNGMPSELKIVRQTHNNSAVNSHTLVCFSEAYRVGTFLFDDNRRKHLDSIKDDCNDYIIHSDALECVKIEVRELSNYIDEIVDALNNIIVCMRDSNVRGDNNLIYDEYVKAYEGLLTNLEFMIERLYSELNPDK